MYETTLEEIELELMKREKEKSWGAHAGDAAATIGRTVAGAVASPLDIITMPYNVVQGLRGKEGFSFAEKAKGFVDDLTDSRGKPTSEAGKLAESAADFISPFGLAKVFQKGAVKGAQKIGQHIAKGSDKVREVIPGRTGKVVDTLVGPKALKNVYAKPTVGNMAGVGAAHLASSESSPITGMLSAVGANTLTDIAGAALGKAGRKIKSVNRTMKLRNPEIRAEVEKRLGSENLADLKSEQAKNTAHESAREQAHKKSVSDAKKAEHQAKVDEILENLAFEKASKDSLLISPDLAKSLSKSSDINAGKSAVKQNKQTNSEMKHMFEDLYKVKGELEAKLGTGDVVNLEDVIKHSQDKFGKKASTRAIQNFFKGEEGELYKSIFDIPHSASTRKAISALYNPKKLVSLDHAKEIVDLTTKNNDLLSMNTSGERGNIKNMGSLTRKAIDKAQKDVDPKAHAELQKVNKLYAATSDLRDAASDVGKSKHSPAEAAHKVEGSLSKDGNAFKMAGTPELVNNILRKAAKTKTGALDSKGLAETLIAMEESTRKMVLNKLPAEQKKEVNRLMRNYVKDADTRAARQLAKDSKLPVYKEPIQPYKNEQPKSYDGKGVGDVQSYLDSLSPEHRAHISADKGVSTSLNQSKEIERLTRAKIPIVQESAHAIRDVGQAILGQSQAKSIPKVVEEVKKLSARPEQTRNIAQRSKDRIGEVASNVPVSKLASMPKHQDRQYETTLEEIELELMKRENKNNVLQLGNVDVPREKNRGG